MELPGKPDLKIGETGLSESLLILLTLGFVSLTGLNTDIFNFLSSQMWGNSFATSYASLIGFAGFGLLYLLNDVKIGDWNTASFRWLTLAAIFHLVFTLHIGLRDFLLQSTGWRIVTFLIYLTLGIGIYKADKYGIGGLGGETS